MFGTFNRANEAYSMASEAQTMAADARSAAMLAASKIDEHVKFCTERETRRDIEHAQNLTSLKEIRQALNRFVWGALVLTLTVLGFILSHAFNFKVVLGG